MVCRQLVVLALVTALVGGLGICVAADPPPLKPHPFGKREHVVQRLNAEKEPAILPAEILWISEPWLRERTDENAQMPYLTYLPEKNRVLMLVETHQPIVTAFIFSDDQGQTWDKEHRYILASWEGNITGETAWFCSVQSTSTVLLPDGTILTSFGTGFRNPSAAKICKMDVALVRWRIDEK